MSSEQIFFLVIFVGLPLLEWLGRVIRQRKADERRRQQQGQVPGRASETPTARPQVQADRAPRRQAPAAQMERRETRDQPSPREAPASSPAMQRLPDLEELPEPDEATPSQGWPPAPREWPPAPRSARGSLPERAPADALRERRPPHETSPLPKAGARLEPQRVRPARPARPPRPPRQPRPAPQPATAVPASVPVAVPTRAAGDRRRRLGLTDRAALRRAVVQRTVLGPCRAVQPYERGVDV